MINMKIVLYFLILMISTNAFSQQDTNLVRLYNPAGVAAPKGYSHVAVINLGTCKMLILSGQVAFDQQGNFVGNHNLAKQTEQVFKNIKAIAEDAGGSMNDVVKLTYFITDASQIQIIRNVRDQFINTKQPPASSLVQVAKLFRDDALIEVEATLIIPGK